jgi:hypothetical protein
MVPTGEDAQEAMEEAQQLPHNNVNNDDHDNDHEEEEEEGNNGEDEDDEDYTRLSDSEKGKMYHEVNEIKTTGNEAPIPTDRLRDLLNRVNITTPPEFRIKRVPRPGWEEYKSIMEIFNGPSVISQHKGLTFRATYRDAVADASWQAITTYNRTYHDKLKNFVYHLLPQRKKDKFKTLRVKANVPMKLMVHHQDMSVEMCIHLQAAQQEIQSLHNQLRDSNVTIRGYQRMVAGEASDLYTSDTYTWLATSPGLGANDEPAVNNHSPSSSRTR